MRVLSLFSGIGAHDLGLQAAGLTIAGQVELDPYCTAVLEKHWPDVPRWMDVRTVTADDVVARCGRIDLVTGGVPCQPASVAGKRQGAADSRWLWPEYFRLVVDLQPEWLLAENVPGFLSLGESGAVFADLEAAGYEVWPLVVGAWAVGAPHKRDRVWIVGRRVGHAEQPRADACPEDGGPRHSIGESGGSLDHALRAGRGIAGEGDAGRGESRGWTAACAAVGGASGAVADATHRGQRTGGQSSRDTGHVDENGNGPHGDGGLDLRTAVQAAQWPTPAARDWRSDAGQQADQDQYGTRGMPLPRVAWRCAGPPAPASPNMSGSSRDWSTPNVPNGGRKPKGGMNETGMTPDGKKRQVGLQNQLGASAGQLNPAWVAQLQGLPDDWLDLPDAVLSRLLATRTRRLSRT